MKNGAPSLTAQQLQFAQDLVSKGLFSNLDEVLSAAVGLLQQLDDDDLERFCNLRSMVQESFDALDAGEFSVYTRETLPEFFQELREQLFLQHAGR